MEKWFGFKVNFKWPHEGICFGISLDFYDEDPICPWSSIVIRILFLTMVYDVGFGDDNKEIYNNQ